MEMAEESGEKTVPIGPSIPPIPPVPVAPPTLAPIPIAAPVPPPPPPVASSSSAPSVIPPPPVAPIRPPPPPSSSTPADEPKYVVSEASRQAKDRHDKAVQDLLLKRRAFALAVPTNDSAVRTRLRRLAEPITLFGEREMERRDRLRSIMLRLEADGKLHVLLSIHDPEEAEAGAAQPEEEEQVQYPFFTEADLPDDLLKARLNIALYSLPRAKSRVDRAKRRRDDPDEDLEKEAETAVEQAQGFVLDCSEIGDARPLSGCSFSKDGTYLATRYASSLAVVRKMIAPICKVPQPLSCSFSKDGSYLATTRYASSLAVGRTMIAPIHKLPQPLSCSFSKDGNYPASTGYASSLSVVRK